MKRYLLPPSKTRIIYTRVPISLGREVEDYGKKNALTLTAAVRALLKSGLAAERSK